VIAHPSRSYKSLSFVSAIKRQRQDIPDGDREGIILNKTTFM
jgi:hypothetical protein